MQAVDIRANLLIKNLESLVAEILFSILNVFLIFNIYSVVFSIIQTC